ncbi:MAG: vitamin K epoxide reductase family protein, partial [Candidatus Methylomirabilia bacterium]
MAQHSRRQQRETVRRDWAVAGLSAGGLLVAGYLAFTKASGGSALLCEAAGGCDVVQASRYALFLGLPTALWGAGLYAAIGVLALVGLTARRWLAAFLLSVVGVTFSAYLTYLELFVIGAVCGYCFFSAGIAVALFGVLLARRSRAPGRRSPVRPARVVAFGIITAVVTVIVGAGVFATHSPPEAGAYA